MGARSKLNVAAVNGCLIIAAVLGLAFGSWFVFIVSATVLIAADVHTGQIRPTGSGRRGR